MFTAKAADAAAVTAALEAHGLVELGHVADPGPGHAGDGALWLPGDDGPRRLATAELRAAYVDEGGLA